MHTSLVRRLSALALFAAGAAHAQNGVKLYALDCGHIHFDDMSMFADTDDYAGKPGELSDPCFVIQHPKGTLVWDTGLGDKLAKSGPMVSGGNKLEVSTTLADQLAKLGVAPDKVNYVAFSHMHFDHTGNANLFPKATWLLNRAEVDWATAKATPFGVDPKTFSAYARAKTQWMTGDTDVFGDGSVRILRAPGHTPGHQMLLVNLEHAGAVVLSGDLYHTLDNYRLSRVPAVNVSRADTLASFDRLEKILRNHRARLVIQHAPEDFEALPKFPAYLD